MSYLAATSRSKKFWKRVYSAEFICAELLIVSQPFVTLTADAATIEDVPEPEPPAQNQTEADASLAVEIVYALPEPEPKQDIEFRQTPSANPIKKLADIDAPTFRPINTKKLSKLFGIRRSPQIRILINKKQLKKQATLFPAELSP